MHVMRAFGVSVAQGRGYHGAQPHNFGVTVAETRSFTGAEFGVTVANAIGVSVALALRKRFDVHRPFSRLRHATYPFSSYPSFISYCGYVSCGPHGFEALRVAKRRVSGPLWGDRAGSRPTARMREIVTSVSRNRKLESAGSSLAVAAHAINHPPRSPNGL